MAWRATQVAKQNAGRCTRRSAALPYAARTSQTRLQRHTAPGTGRSAMYVASRQAEKLQGGLCAFTTPALDPRRKSTQNYPRSLRSAAQRWNIALNTRRALANLAARSRAVTAVVKSIVLMSILPAQVSAMLFMQHDKCGRMVTRVTIALIAPCIAAPTSGARFAKTGLKNSVFKTEFLHIDLEFPNTQHIVSFCMAVKW